MGDQPGLACVYMCPHMHTLGTTLQATRQQPQALCLRDEAHKGLSRVHAGSRTKVSACRGWGGFLWGVSP